LIAFVYNNREVNKFDRSRSRKHDSFGSITEYDGSATQTNLDCAQMIHYPAREFNFVTCEAERGREEERKREREMHFRTSIA